MDAITAWLPRALVVASAVLAGWGILGLVE
jgi:hypothetical protein